VERRASGARGDARVEERCDTAHSRTPGGVVRIIDIGEALCVLARFREALEDGRAGDPGVAEAVDVARRPAVGPALATLERRASARDLGGTRAWRASRHEHEGCRFSAIDVRSRSVGIQRPVRQDDSRGRHGGAGAESDGDRRSHAVRFRGTPTHRFVGVACRPREQPTCRADSRMRGSETGDNRNTASAPNAPVRSRACNSSSTAAHTLGRSDQRP